MDRGRLRRALALKRDGGALDAATWSDLVAGYVAGLVGEAEMAALAMACTIRGMSDDETAALTDAMVRSGETLQIGVSGVVVDKHSSGGVGDTVSLIAVPLVAACGVSVAKLSGRALGHTGGTLDKLEAVPGVRTDLSAADFIAQVRSLGCAIAAQTASLVPADKQLYALRDRTATVPSVGLIAASIVSKKIAAGADAIVFDVKTGGGAFMKTLDDATTLARALVALAGRSGRRASALVSDMDEPLGAAIGSGIEAIEARDLLRDRSEDTRLRAATLAVAAEMLRLAGIADGETRAAAALADGSAYERFVALIEAQGGSRAALEQMRPHASQTVVRAASDGVVTAIDATALGELARDLVAAAGPFAGIRIRARVGTPVRAGDSLAEVYGDAPRDAAAAFTVGVTAPPVRPLVATVVRDAHATTAANVTVR